MENHTGWYIFFSSCLELSLLVAIAWDAVALGAPKDVSWQSWKVFFKDTATREP